MATTYTNLMQKVRDWANRDPDALPDPVIQDSLRWAADTAYRELRVPPLEYTQQYLVLAEEGDRDSDVEPEDAEQVVINPAASANLGFTSVNLPVPADATVFIQLRTSGKASRDATDMHWLRNTEDGGDGCLTVGTGSLRDTQVFNEKVDVRTYHDALANKVSDAFWTRQENNLLVTGRRISPGDVIQLYYFRRLPALDARYGLVPGDYDLDEYPTDGFSEFVDQDVAIFSTVEDPVDRSTPLTQTQVDALGIDNPSLSPTDFEFFDTGDVLTTGWYAGIHVPHWLREENERILVFGALNECFAYLADDAQSSKYLQKYLAEIQELNKEEKMRKSSGGNVQVHYNSYII